MKISVFNHNSVGATQYLERYVNDGSPSGFTQLNTTSPASDPFGLTPWFWLHRCSGPSARFKTFGEIPNWPGDGKDSWILVHPDMTGRRELSSGELQLELFDARAVVPTASARTVQFRGPGTMDYIKLHYDDVLGRVNRALPWPKAVAGVEVSRLVTKAIKECKVYDRLALLPEIGARVLTPAPMKEGQDVGMVWRSRTPVRSGSTAIHHVLPYFSLFSVDRLAPYDPPLLAQLLAHCASPKEYILESLLLPIIRSYFSLLKIEGLQVEWNAQNLLVGLDVDLKISAIIMRDCGETEKDLTIRSRRGLPNIFESAPYKCIDINKPHYRVRHSFAFDFKLGEYILEPIIKLLCDLYGDSADMVRSAIRAEVSLELEGMPDDFFPTDGKWYLHDRIILTGERPYVARERPKFR